MKYVSDLKELENRKFDSVKELEAAELEIKKAAEKKEEVAKVRKQDATKVEEAFKARNAARKDFNTKAVEARKEYNKVVLEAKKILDEKIAALEKALTDKEDIYTNALKEFTVKYPEGYHMTLKDGDNVTTISRDITPTERDVERVFNVFDSLLDSFLW